VATPTLPAMTGAEMQVTREFLALSRGRLANHLVLNERRMLRMEAGQEQIPQVIVSTLDDIYEETKDEVQRLTAEYRRKVKASGDNVTIRTYRSDKEYWAAGGKYPSRWHRMVCGRLLGAVPGLVLVYE
jgi:hypothetical protein